MGFPNEGHAVAHPFLPNALPCSLHGFSLDVECPNQTPTANGSSQPHGIVPIAGGRINGMISCAQHPSYHAMCEVQYLMGHRT